MGVEERRGGGEGARIGRVRERGGRSALSFQVESGTSPTPVVALRVAPERLAPFS